MADQQDAVASYESKEDAERDSVSFVKSWLDALDLAEREEKNWTKKAQDTYDVYRSKKKQSQRNFNILHSNVETICPAIYNSTPIPDVRRRYLDKDPVGKQVADVLERAISFSVDACDFDLVMKATVRDGEVAGRGIPRVRYLPTFGEDGMVAYEEVQPDYVPWKQFRRGPGRTWADVPWVAFEDFLTKEELTKLAGEEVAKQVPMNYSADSAGVYQKTDGEQSIFKRCRVWQIWDKEAKRVISICPDWTKKALRTLEDPLELTGFFPVSRPYQPVMTTDSLVPVVPYEIYEDLVQELNDVNSRIAKLVKQLRPRGGYGGNAADIKAMADADDGELVPLANIEALIANGGGGIDKLITWFPLEPVILALAQLVPQREAIKQTIYEVTGISDILRGQSNAAETATAQNIKAQWGSLRIQERQSEAARVARDVFRMMAEIIAAKFSTETITMMTGLPVTPEMEKILRDDVARNYRIDVESDSTIRGDLGRNQEQMANFVQGTAQYAQAMGPLVEMNPTMMQPAIEIYSAFARSFKLGKQAEDALDNLSDAAKQQSEQQQQPQGPSPEEVAAQQEQHAAELKAQTDQHATEVKAQTDQQAAQMQQQTAAHQAQLKAQTDEHQAQLRQATDTHKAQLDAARHDAKLQQEDRHHSEKMALQRDQMDRDHEFKRDQMTKDHGLKRAAQNKQIMDDANEETGEQPDEGQTPFEKTLEQVAGITQALTQAVAVIAQGQQQQQAELRQVAEDQAKALEALTRLAEAAAAPKRIVYGSNGRPSGVEVVH